MRVLAHTFATIVLLSNITAAQLPVPEPTFRSNAELVMIPAVVHGKTGHTPGLKKEDFVILEDGKPRQIAVFSEVQGKAETVQHVPLPDGGFTNELIGVDSPKRLTVIAVDMINTAPLDQTVVREALIKFLSQAAPNGEPTALVAIEQHSMRVIYDFTTDPKKLAAAVTEMKSEQVRKDEPSASLENKGVNITRFEAYSVQPLLAWLQAKQGEEDMLQFQWRMGRFSTVEAMRQLTSWLAGIPGRKSLIWATGGLPFSESTRLFIPR
ncbi:MAG TPA: VWA domain-containing protein, partial [Terriglobales bacterium]|nr:VWA domain-containing protein [Terriglobales bacterium]